MTAYADREGLIPPAARVVVALSGGPDSCALLLALLDAAGRGLVPRPVGAAHFHHGLRGSDADADAAFAAALCARFALPCVVGLGHAPPRPGQSPNEAARDARYDFLIGTARQWGADTVATAHTLDDQAETVLMRVLRGTGVDGLAGIPPRRRVGDIALLRPLLSQTRADVEAFCAAQGVVPRRDPSNERDRYTRTRIRRVLPALANDFNPRLPVALSRLAAHAAADSALLQALAGELWDGVASVDGASVTLDAPALRAAPDALRRRVLLRALRHAAGEAGTLAQTATDAFVSALEQILHNPGAFDLPGRTRAHADSHALTLAPPPSPTLPPALAAPVALRVPGVTAVPWAGREIVARVGEAHPSPTRSRRPFAVEMAGGGIMRGDCAAPPALVVRPAVPGERFAPLGMEGKTRAVRDMLASAGIPASERAAYPVVARADGGEVLWIIGVAQSESTRVNPNDPAPVLHLSANGTD